MSNYYFFRQIQLSLFFPQCLISGIEPQIPENKCI